MKVFISQPMRGRKPEEIEAERYRIQGLIEAELQADIEVLDSYHSNEPKMEHPLKSLGDSLKLLSQADLAVFAHGWDNACGCRVEHLACVEYGITHKEL